MTRTVKLSVAVLAVFFFFIVPMVVIYNGLVEKQETARRSWSQVENVTQRRADLIPNLVETVQGYARHEKGVLTAVTEARSMATQVKIDPKDLEDPVKFEKYVEAQKKLDGALSRLLVVVEQYPQLKASESFHKLQDALEGAENRISVERKRYNEAATEYNKALRKFPGNIFTGIGDFKPLALFKADEKAKEVPKVKFD